MTDARRDDVRTTTPGTGPGDPLAPLSSQGDQFLAALNLVFEDPGEFVERVRDDVLAMPPEDRFTESFGVLCDHVEAEFGSVEALQSQLPAADADRTLAYVAQLFETMRAETLRRVTLRRDADPHLVLAVAYQSALAAIGALTDESSDVDAEVGYSSLVAVWARLTSVKDGESEITDEDTIEDVLRALSYPTTGRQFESTDGEDLSVEQARQEVRQLGAVLAYREQDITVSRGAELADVSQSDFEHVLDHYGVEPRYGPESVPELYGDDE